MSPRRAPPLVPFTRPSESSKVRGIAVLVVDPSLASASCEAGLRGLPAGSGRTGLFIQAASSLELRAAAEFDPSRTALRCPRRAERLDPDEHTLLGFLPLQRSRRRAATCAGFTSPDCAAPPGFSRPLDALIPPVAVPVLFHTGDAPGVRPSEGFPSRRRSPSRRSLPLLTSLSTAVVRPSEREPGPRCRSTSSSLARSDAVRLARGRGLSHARLQGFELVLEVRTPVSGG